MWWKASLSVFVLLATAWGGFEVGYKVAQTREPERYECFNGQFGAGAASAFLVDTRTGEVIKLGHHGQPPTRVRPPE